MLLDARLVHVSGRIGPMVGVEVSESHVADAEPVIIPQEPRAVLYGVTALQSHQSGDLPLAMSFDNVIRGQGSHEDIWITVDNIMLHRVDHLERTIGGVIAVHVLCIHKNREEDGADAALPQSGDIGMVLGRAVNVGPVDRKARDIVMRIDQNGGARDLRHFAIEVTRIGRRFGFRHPGSHD